MMENFVDKIREKINNYLVQLDHRFPRAKFRSKSASFVPTFVISVTSRCNFNCPHCLRNAVDRKKTIIEDLPISTFETVLKEGKKLGFGFVSFTGGEPILHPKFSELVSLATHYNYRYNIASNGWLYKNYWPIIEKNRQNFELIFFSVDGTTAEIHDSVRNRIGSFNKLIEAIEFYKKKQLPIVMTFCMTKKNIQELEKMPDFCLNLGVNCLKLTTVISVKDKTNNFSKNDILTDTERMEAFQKILDLQKKFEGRCDFWPASSFYPISKNTINFCHVLNSGSFYIDYNGGMLLCCDITYPCENKPLIKELGFEKCLELTLDSINRLKKMHAHQILNDKNPKGSTCDFCNQNIESCLTPS